VKAAVEKSLGYGFKRPELLDEALTHRSAVTVVAPDGGDSAWNERLEFLGDAVLSLGISTRLHARAEQFKEGELSKIRAALVNEGFLAGVARRIKLGDAIRLGRGERKAGLDDQDSILADALEAVLGAVYLDGGFDAARSVVDRLFQEELGGPLDHLFARDFKTELQEVVQGRLKERPDYVVLDESGPQHARTFTVAVSIQGIEMGRGTGNTKKNAAQAAAAVALRTYARQNEAQS
jgi:ribonuclease-3